MSPIKVFRCNFLKHYCPNLIKKFSTQINAPTSSKNPKFTIQQASHDHLDEILKFVYKNFFRHEPLFSSQNLTEAEVEEFFITHIQAALLEPVSFLARSHTSDQIIGLRLALTINRPGLPITRGEKFLFDYQTHNPKIQNVIDFLDGFKDYKWTKFPPNIHCLLHALILCCDANYRGHGIATSLVKHAAEQAKLLGCQGEITETTAYNSQKLYEKLGYKNIFAIEYTTWKNRHGEVIFKNMPKNTSHAMLKYRLYE